LSGGGLVKKRLSGGPGFVKSNLAGRLSGLPRNNNNAMNRRGRFNQNQSNNRITRVGAGRGMGLKGRVQSRLNFLNVDKNFKSN